MLLVAAMLEVPHGDLSAALVSESTITRGKDTLPFDFEFLE